MGARLALVVALALFAGCVELASELDAECEPRCLNENTLKSGANDLLFTSPGIWRFFDDYAQTLTPACGEFDGGQSVPELVPLWRHVINPEVATVPPPKSGRIGKRGAIAAHSNGKVAVSIGGTVWLFDGATGKPEHALLAATVSPTFNRGRLDFDPVGVAAFTPDGGGLWVKAANHPALLDLAVWDRRHGPNVTVAWRANHPGDPWDDGSQAVGADGTLYWRSTSGAVRALDTDGGVRWELSGLGGTPRVDANDFIFWSDAAPARGFASSDGREVWRPQSLAQWNTSELTNSENAAGNSLIPVKHQTNTRGELSLHRLDGTIAAVFEFGVDGGLGFVPDSTAQSHDTLFSALHESPAGAGLIEAFAQSSRVKKWSTQLSPLATDPMAGANDALFVATIDCRISMLDGRGIVTKSHRMAGRPTGDLLQLQNGILYVLTEIDVGLSGEERVFPGQFTVPREDGGVSSIDDYECFSSEPFLCGQPIVGANPLLFMLYAFKVE